MNLDVKKILLSGGGTGGSVTPLLAVAAELNKETERAYDFLFIGTSSGPEKELVIKDGLNFKIIASGKLRRYFSWKNFIDPFKILFGFFQAFFILLNYRPNLVLSAGGFVAVPVACAAWILRIPVISHQQDVRPGLANKLMAPFSKIVTVAFAESLKDYGRKAVLIGNPVKIAPAVELNLDLAEDLPLVVIIGGGTGSAFINNLVDNSLIELLKFCQIVHVAGKGKLLTDKTKNYYAFEFLEHARLFKIMEMADVVVSRCGLGALTELCFLKKPSILIPMPNSHQEDNSKVFQEKGAAIVLNEKGLSPELFITQVKTLLDNKKLRAELRSLIEGVIKIGNADLVKIIKNLLK